jgi:nucleoside-diphosphate-sugar epimerase
MRVFVTGASGWVGSALVPQLIEAGHEVLGLARSDESAAALRDAGADVHRGSLDEPTSLRAGAAEADGVVHLAFIHDFSRFEASVRADLAAIETMGEVLEGSNRPLVIASGVLALTDKDVATEEDPPHPEFPRSRAAAVTLELADRGVRSSVVRLPPTVHGQGDTGFVPTLIEIARQRGVSGYVGDGANRWPAVHRLDAAQVFLLALENAPAGSVWHAVAEEGVATRSIAEVIGRHLEIPLVSVPPDTAAEHFDWLGLFFAADVAASSSQTRERLGWQPTHPALLEDLDAGHYFDESASRGVPFGTPSPAAS